MLLPSSFHNRGDLHERVIPTFAFSSILGWNLFKIIHVGDVEKFRIPQIKLASERERWKSEKARQVSWNQINSNHNWIAMSVPNISRRKYSSAITIWNRKAPSPHKWLKNRWALPYLKGITLSVNDIAEVSCFLSDLTFIADQLRRKSSLRSEFPRRRWHLQMWNYV